MLSREVVNQACTPEHNVECFGRCVFADDGLGVDRVEAVVREEQNLDFRLAIEFQNYRWELARRQVELDLAFIRG